MTKVIVEFFGIARTRTGCSQAELMLDIDPIELRDVVTVLRDTFPALNDECIAADRAAPGYLFSVDGFAFVCEPGDRIDPARPLLLMSADAGG